MHVRSLIALLTVVLLTSCGNKKPAEARDSTMKEDPVQDEEVQDEAPRVFSASDALQIDRDAFRSATMNTSAESDPWVEGDNLHIPVKYAACNKHEDWMLVGSPVWMKSLPPQKPIRLFMINPVEELCPANDGIRDTLVFDLKPARYPGQNRVVLNLVGDREFRIEYVYDTE